MKKTKKTLASLAIAGMVLSMAPMSVFAATNVTRISDADRVGTAIAIAANGWTASDSVIVVPADDANIVDALAAAPLAGQLNAPILVTYKGALDPAVQQKIVDLKAKNVYAVGALSTDAVNSLKAIAGVTVTTLQGADRTETAAKVAAQLSNIKGSFVVAYNGTADAMSAASFAAANGYSILVANPDGTLPSNEAAFKGATQYTVGGQVTMAGAKALAGADRYATNDAVVKELSYQYDTVYVANGETLVDALAGAPLAAKTKSPIVLADTTHAAQGVAGNLTANSQVIALGGEGVVPENVREQVGHPTAGTGAVQSVSAINATSLKVVFSAAPADTSKVTFAVARSTTPITVTTTWNDAKTEATLTSNQNLPEGTYTVAVKNDGADLGTSTVDVTAQKIAKINITSTKLAVSTDASGKQTAYATYNVLDQYGNDITSSSLAKSLTFQSGISNNIEYNDGMLTLDPGTLNLLQFSTVDITGFDQASGVSTSANLAVLSQVGTLSSFKLTTLTNADGKVLTEGDSSLFYAGYTATDVSGNPTTNIDLIKGGLILNNDALTTSSPYVTAKVVADPSDSTKALIEVQAVPGTKISMDTPVTITAMTWTGTNSSLNVTLKKAATVDKITLMAPAYDIALGDKDKVIPFVAYDQNGVQITKASDITGVTFSNNLKSITNVDGTMSVVFTPQAKGTQVLTALTSTGNYSSLTLNVQDTATASSLALDSSVLATTMEASSTGREATQSIDTGYKYGGLTVKDQYGRTMNLTASNSGYEVITSVSANAPFTVSNSATGSTPIVIKSGSAAGTGTVTFKLVAKGSTEALDQKSITLSVVDSADITDFAMDTVANPIYTAVAAGTGIVASTDAKSLAYAANPNVYGKTKSGSEVLLAGTPIIGVYSSSTDFTTDFTGAAVAADSVNLVAKQFTDSAKTGSSTTLTVTVKDAEGNVHSVSTPVSSTTTAPSATSVVAYADKSKAGISVNSLGDIITLDTTNGASLADAGLTTVGGYLTRYNPSGAQTDASFYFYGLDQYGTKAAGISQVVLVSDKLTNGSDGTFALNADGTIKTAPTSAPQTITLSAITSNGLIKTIQIIIK